MNKAKQIFFDTFFSSYLMALAAVTIVQPSEEQLLDLGHNAICVGIFAIIGLVFSEISLRSGLKTLGAAIFLPESQKRQTPAEKWFRTLWGWQLLVGFLATLYIGFIETQINFGDLIDMGGFSGAVRLFSGVATPNFAILPRAILSIIETIYIAFMATILAVPFAFVLSFFSAKNLMHGPLAFSIYGVLRSLLNIIRSIEALIWAIIASVWVGIGPFAGMLALWIHSIASLTKQYSEIVESISSEPLEGIQSTGANKLQTIWFGVVPQIVLPYISFTIYRWDINVRMATVIGLVGGGGIGTILIQYQGQAMWHEVGCLILVIAVVVWIMDTFSAYIREALK